MLLFYFIQEVANTPMITDWLQGIGTIIGVPAAIAAFIMLFVKDKFKQNQINKLIEIADELKKQTNEFAVQTQQMMEYNAIIKEQVDLQYSIQTDNKEYQTQMSDLKKKELKSKNRPLFVYTGEGYSGPKKIDVTLKNIGESAKITRFKELGNGKINMITNDNFEIGKNKVFHLEAEYIGEENVHHVDNIIEMFFEDLIGNKYKHKVKIRGNNVELLSVEEVSD